MTRSLIALSLLLTTLGQSLKAIDFPTLEGWTKDNSPQTYTPTNLWNIINGAAINYLRYQFVSMETIRYIRADSVYITVEVYRHATPENAFGIYAQERPRMGSYSTIGAQSYSEGGLFNFVTGCYYGKLISHSPDAMVAAAMRDIAIALVSATGNPSDLPGQLQWFPTAKKIPFSEQYTDSTYLGHKGFNKVFQADYQYGKETPTLFVVTFPDSLSACKEIEHFQHLATTCPVRVPVFFTNPNYGRMALVQKGNTLAGTFNFASKNTAKVLLSGILCSLP